MKRIIKIPLLLLCVLLVIGCGNSKTAAELQREAQSFEELKAMVASKSFEFEAEASYPMQTNAVVNVTTALLRNTGSNGTRQDLTGNNDYIRVKNDTVSAELSYFGELRIATYNDVNNAGINFNTIPKDFKTEIDEDKKEIIIKYEADSANDQFDVIMLLFANQKANVSIYGANRTGIKYTGRIKRIEKDELP